MAEQQCLYIAPVVQVATGDALDDIVIGTAASGQQKLVSKGCRSFFALACKRIYQDVSIVEDLGRLHKPYVAKPWASLLV